MGQTMPQPLPALADTVRLIAQPYEKKFSYEVIGHRRNVERDMLVALAVFIRKHGRAALRVTR